VVLGDAPPPLLSSLRLATTVELGFFDPARLPHLRRLSFVLDHAPAALLQAVRQLDLDELHLDGAPLGQP
jgi:hypothetical protein